MLLRNHKNSKEQGGAGVGAAIEWFLRHQYPVLIPLIDGPDYDLGVEIAGRLCRVQVRTTYYRNAAGSYQVHLRVCGGNRSGTGKVKFFDPERVDYIFALTEAGDKYLIPSRAITATSSISLCDKYAQYRVE